LKYAQRKALSQNVIFSGKFNLRISPQLHEKLAIAAQARGKSINALAQETLQENFA
jgi:predicted HicB family RNase H-like nuclease